MPGVYQQTTTPGGEDFRADADLHAQQREEWFRKAEEAYEQNRGDLAQQYSRQGHVHNRKMHEANKRAAQMIFASKYDS